MKLARTPFIVLASILLMLSVIPAYGNEVLIVPGYITGNINTNILDYQAKNIFVRAAGSGFASSNNIDGSDSYSLTVQSGGWDYTTNLEATVGPADGSLPSTKLTFSDRVITVGTGETVSNDYNATGTVHFNVIISGDEYTSWYGEASAGKATDYSNATPRSESTTNSATSYSWEMPVVPNEQIQIRAKVSVYSQYGTVYYHFFKSIDPDDRLFLDISDGQSVDVDLNINHIAPPPEPEPEPELQPEPEPGTRTLDLRFFLDMNIDGQSYNDQIIRHGGSEVDGNPGHRILYGVNENFWMGYPVYTVFDSPQSALTWPWATGRVAIQPPDLPLPGETAYFNYEEAAGKVNGHLRFTGAATNSTFSNIRLNLSSVYKIDQQIQTDTWGASTYFRFDDSAANPEGNFSLFLTGGPWDSKYIIAERRDYSLSSQGIISTSNMSIKDYNHRYDGDVYDFGQNLQIVAGQSTTHEREYCLGKGIFRFRTSDGSLLRNPSVWARSGTSWNDYAETGMAVAMNGRYSSGLVEAPEVELYGPTMQYYASSLSVIAEDGSYISFTPQTFSLDCGVTKVIPVPGPSLIVDNPQADILTNAPSVTVSGVANSDVGVIDITVNGDIALFAATGNPDVALQEVAFSYELPLVDGVNSIFTEATDSGNNPASDERSIRVDQSVPTILISNPPADASFSPGTPIDVTFSVMDRGYGFGYQFYLDGELLKDIQYTPQDDITWEFLNDSHIISASKEDQIVKIVATDLAGNSSTLTYTIRGNTPPVAAAGLDQIVEQSSFTGADVSLDGTGSYDPDGDSITCSWTGAFGTLSGCNVNVSLPFGDHAISLNVSDGLSATTDDLLVSVVDTTPPSLTPPVDVSAEQTNRDGTTVGIGTAQAIDISDPAPVITNNAPAVFQLGSTIITWTATDVSGNSASATQVVTMVDTTPPVGTMSVTPELLWPPDHKYIEVTPSFLVSDICDDEMDIVLDSITMNEGEETNTYYPEIDGTYGDGNTVQDIKVENGLIYLRAERSGQGTGRIYFIKFKFIDDSGNIGYTEATVMVPHSM